MKILESDNKDDYSDLEFRLLLDTFKKFMRRDIHTRYKYLTRMASIIYQVVTKTKEERKCQNIQVFDTHLFGFYFRWRISLF